MAFARKCNLRTTRTFAYRFTNCAGVSAYVKSQGNTDDAAAVLAVYEVGAGNALSAVETVTSKAKAADIITVDGLSMSKTYVAYVYGMNSSNGEFYEIGFLAPSEKISATPTSVTLTATESGVAMNGSFTITGSNLTAGNYDLNIPSVAGLTVSPTSFTVAANGTVSQEISVSYSSTVNVAANTASITATVGAVSLAVPINYSANVVSWTLQSISETTEWDFSTKVSGSKEYSGDDLNAEHVYANNSDLSFSSGFNQYALAFTGQFPFRDNSHKYAQNGTLHFNTTVPGTIVVKFSDTGSSASASAVKRYLKVNDEATEYWASRAKTGDGAYDAQLNVTTDAIAVPAGDVTISGTSALIYTYVKFTPTEQQVSTLSGRNYASYVTTQKLDFASAEGITAYIATGFNADKTGVVLQEVDVVPAGTPIIVKTDTKGATVNVSVTTDAASDVSDNELVAGDGVKTWNGTDGYTYYYLASDQFHKATSGTLQSGKAYLKVANGDVPSAPQLSIVFGEGGNTTGINAVNGEGLKVQGFEVYNLNGQRVLNPTKGLYIVNGRKVVIK